ncbi:MAG: hypothetical protein KAG64_04855 [Bacteroidales bacterium]|nr:hypothetical protein [Bacteroidales bacterium]
MRKSKLKINRGLILAFILPYLLSSCHYDNYDDLVIQGAACDTISLTYSVDIAPIMSSHCTSCHGGAAPAANIALENYSDVKVSALNGGLLGTVEHASAWSPMPKNQPKLVDCTISKLNAWINQGVKE